MDIIFLGLLIALSFLATLDPDCCNNYYLDEGENQLDGLIPEWLELDDRVYEPLSNREIEIMCYYANPYYEYNFISEQLNISVNTVKTHIAHVFDKLGETDRYSASITFFRLYPQFRKILESLIKPAA